MAALNEYDNTDWSQFPPSLGSYSSMDVGAVLKDPTPFYPLAAQLVRKQGWEPKMREGINRFFSEENRTARAKSMPVIANLLEKTARFLGNAAVDQVTAPVDPLAAATYGGKSAKFFPKKGTFSNMADKLERFEISDKGIKIKAPFDSKYNMYDGVRTLEDLIDHPKLFKQYPYLKDIEISQQTSKFGLNQGTSASYSPNGNGIPERITIIPENTKEMKSTLLHEIQHAIQEREGFARGGSPVGMVTTGRDTFMEVYRKHYADTLAVAQKNDPTIKKLPDWIDKEVQKEAMQMSYRNLSGEIEARDAASRMNLTGQQRRRTGPYTSEDIPLSDWITRK